MDIPKENILNLRIDAINLPFAINYLNEILSYKINGYICCIPIHSIFNSYKNPKLRNVFNTSILNTPDGMGVVWLLKLAGYKDVSRVYGPDLLLSTCKNFPTFRHYFLGGSTKSNLDLQKKLKEKIPNLEIVGHSSPSYTLDSLKISDDLKDEIIKCRPEIIWVGLGSPKQELFMYENYRYFPGSIMIGVGAAFDFLSGNKPQAPIWIQKSGFEWLFRLFSEPKRLWKRYLLGYPKFFFLLIRELILKKK